MAPRNILLVVSDDHARWALPVYGNPDVDAPHLDALAARGMVFEQAYTPTPVCSPARASLFTGLRASQHGIHDFLQSRQDFDDKDWLGGNPTLTEELAAEGYETALVGKWHVGRDWLNPPGVEHAFTLNGEYPIHHDGDNGFARNGVAERRTGNLTEILTEEAGSFLKQRDRTRPFFLTLGYYATHSPWRDQPEALCARYADVALPPGGGGEAPGRLNIELEDPSPAGQRAALANYYAAVTHIDQGLGQVLQLLMDLGDLDDTLVVYTADHGLCMGQHGVWGKGNATRPQNLLDDSIRIPMILAGSGVPPGVRSANFVDHLDLHAALRALAGLAPLAPETHAGSAPAIIRPEAPGRPLQFAEYGTLRMARSPEFKLLAWTDGRPPGLFAVGSGADETVDLSADPALGPLLLEMLAALNTHFARYSRPEQAGAEAMAAGRFNLNQAWHDFVAPAASLPGARA